MGFGGQVSCDWWMQRFTTILTGLLCQGGPSSSSGAGPIGPPGQGHNNHKPGPIGPPGAGSRGKGAVGGRGSGPRGSDFTEFYADSSLGGRGGGLYGLSEPLLQVRRWR